MKKMIAILFWLHFCLLSKAQMYDAQWALGDGESVVDFRNLNSVRIDTLPTIEYFTLTSASICDESGNLLYYTNGISICGVNDTLINGSGLSPCAYTEAYAINGLNINEAALFIPQPCNSRYYYLFHFSNNAYQNSRPGTMYYSLIDKEGNAGIGEVIEKNIPILNGPVLRGGGMTACKHANGRDYWLIMGASNSNGFYKFLITPDSILGPYIQNIGPVFTVGDDVAYSKFSQDGSKYATGIYSGPIVLMDFDRCSGDFSNPIQIYHEASSDPIHFPLNGCASLEF